MNYTTHISDVFEFDKFQTEKGYANFEFDQTKSTIQRVSYLNQIKEFVARQDLKIGINFMKPWEEIEMDDYYLIEYLFVGRLITKNNSYISDPELGINFNLENRFGQIEFESNDLINLTILINKNKSTPIKQY